MDKFTARSALLTGVALIRRRPLLVLLWAAMLLAQTLVFGVATREIMEHFWAGGFNWRPAASLTGQLLALSLVRVAVSLVIAAVLWCSAFRAVLRPAERRLLGFGPEELSVLAVWFMIQLLVVIVSASLPLLIGRRLVDLGVNPMTYILAAFDVLGLFWSAVATVWAFDQRQIAPIRCWTIARGRFWLLAGLVVGVAVLERLAGSGVHQLTLALARHLPPTNVVQTNPLILANAAARDLFKAPALLRDVLAAALGSLEIAFIAGVVACAYRARDPEAQAATFSWVVSGPAS